MSLVAIGVLALWVGLTIALQIPASRSWLRSKAFCVLIPEYRFFAPKPVEGDYHLLYRDLYADGTKTSWTEAVALRPRSLSQAFFHPWKRERKALFDAVVQIQDLDPAEPRAIAMTVPYLAVLNHVTSLPRSTKPTYAQFAVMQSYGWDSSREMAAVIISRPHRL